MLKLFKILVILFFLILVGNYVYGLISDDHDYNLIDKVTDFFSSTNKQFFDMLDNDTSDDEDLLSEIETIDSEVVTNIQQDELNSSEKNVIKKAVSYFKYNPSISKNEYLKKLSVLIPKDINTTDLPKIIIDISEQSKFDPIFITLLIGKVSEFQSDAISPKGRYGLLQVSSNAIKAYNEMTEQNISDDASRLLDPPYNIKVSLTLLKIFLQKSNNNMQRAIQAFYWGDGSILEGISKNESIPYVIQSFSESVINDYIETLKKLKNNDEIEYVRNNFEEYAKDVVHYPSEKDIVNKKFDEAKIQQKELLIELLFDQSTKTNIDPLLILSMMEALSELNPNKVSSNGYKIGLMQVDIKKGNYIEKLCHIKWKGVEALKDPIYNFVFGMSYFKFLNDKIFKGNKSYTIISYLWDPKNLFTSLKQKDGKIPFQIKNDFKKILFSYQKLKKELITPLNSDNIQKGNSKKGVTKEVKKMELEVRNNVIKENQTPAKISDYTSKELSSSVKIEVKKQIVKEKAKDNDDVLYFTNDINRLAKIVNSYGISKKLSIDIADRIFKASKSAFLEPLFVAAIIQQECNFYWFGQSKSTDNKYGIFQLTVDEAQKIASRVKMTPPTLMRLKETQISLKLVTKYLYLLGKNFDGDKRKTLEAYYAGSDRLSKAIKNKSQLELPDDIRKKVDSTLTTYGTWKKKYIIKKQ